MWQFCHMDEIFLTLAPRAIGIIFFFYISLAPRNSESDDSIGADTDDE